MDSLRWVLGRFADLVGWLGISGYTLRVGLGLAAGLVWWEYSTRTWLSRIHMVLLPAIAGLCAIVAGRAGFVLENALYFQQNPEHITALRTVGGLHGSAALIGATLALLGASLFFHLPRDKVLVCAIPVLLLATAGAWRASILAGNAIGKAIDNPQGLMRCFVRDGRDLYGSVDARFAVQHLAAWAALVSALFAMQWRQFASRWLALFALGCAALTLMRGDTVPMWAALRSDTLCWSAVALLYLLLATVLKREEQGNANTIHRTN